MLHHYYLALLLIVLGQSNNNWTWVLQQTRPMSSELLQFYAIANDSLLIQTANSIYVAPNNNPSLVQQAFTNSLGQHIHVAFDQQSSTYLYIDFQYLHYGQPNSSQKRTLQDFEQTVNIIKIKDTIYFIQPTICSNLMIYNLTLNKTMIGPYLIESDPTLTGSSIIANPQETQILIAIDDRLFVVSVETLEIQQTFYNRQSSTIELLDVASSSFFVHSTQTFKNIYKYDQTTKKSSLIYTLSIDENLSSKFGYVCDQILSICKEVQFHTYTSDIYTRVTEMDCSQPYDKLVDRLEEAKLSLHIVGDDKSSIYSLKGPYENPWLIKHEIKDNAFIQVYNRSLLVELDIYNYKLFRIWKDELIVFQDIRFTIIDQQRKAEICKKQISEYEGLKNDVSEVFFNYEEEEIFIFIRNNMKNMIWINVKTCEIKSKDFDFNLLSILFWNRRMLLILSDSPLNFYELDPVTKEIIRKSSNPAINCIIFKENMYGFIPGPYIYTIVKIKANMDIVASKQLSCQSQRIFLKVGTDHISAITCTFALCLILVYCLRYQFVTFSSAA